MFNANAFNNAQWSPRTEAIAVPDLIDFFDGAEPMIKVRGLTANELARCNEAATKRSNINLVISQLALSQEHLSDIKKLLGNSDDVPGEIAKRLEMLTLAAIDPKFTLDTVIKLADCFPLLFYELTNKILNLTGQGKVQEKPKPSGAIAA